MIVASLHPSQIPVDQAVAVTLRLENQGRGACTNVRFSLRLPREIRIIQGGKLVQVPLLKPGAHHDHHLRLKATKQGAFVLVSNNFSYRDPAGLNRRIHKTSVSLEVVAPLSPSVPKVALTLKTKRLPAGAWSPLVGVVRNVGRVAVRAIHLTARGPGLRLDRRETLGALLPGQDQPFDLRVCADEVGEVPIDLELAFQDPAGRAFRYSSTQHLVVGQVPMPPPPPTSAEPIILIAFANDHNNPVRYLRDLSKERRQIKERLDHVVDSGRCRLVSVPDATITEILDSFQKEHYRNRIAIFHVGGHANAYQLLFESSEGEPAPADAEGFARFLSTQKGLRLVFLNGCSTQQQVEGLIQAGVSAVIATAEAIRDEVARVFADRFYAGLAGGATIREAYTEAEAAVRVSQGGQPRDVLRKGAQLPRGIKPWLLYVKEEAGATWRLPHPSDERLPHRRQTGQTNTMRR